MIPRRSIGYGVAGGSAGTKTITNAIVTNMNNTDFAGVSATYFNTFNNGVTSAGTGSVTFNPLVNGLLLPARIESGSALKTAGEGGGQIGAQVVSRIGAAGSLRADTGWNADTGTPLWPFPNEARIKKEICTDVGVTRGFCSNASFTNYVMSYVGGINPY